MTIVLAGGTGFLGQALATHLEARGHFVRVLTRRPQPGAARQVGWQPDGSTGPWADTLADADVIVNLAGEGIADKRWTAARKQALAESRILPARSLAAALAAAPPRPRLLIANTAIGYYGAHDEEPVTEETPPGTDFLARLCVAWEAEAEAAASASTRVAVVRTGIVLHADGGALAEMLTPFRLGLGGPMGSGRQFMSWIHRDDWLALVAWLAEGQGGPQGGVSVWNATAPTPVRNADFARSLGRVLGRPAFVRAPAVALRLLLGEFAAFVLTGARVVPANAQARGFRFEHPALEPALASLLG